MQAIPEAPGLNEVLVEHMSHHAEQKAGKVAFNSHLEFLLVALERCCAFKNHNEDERILQVEMKRLVTIVMCSLPSFGSFSLSVSTG